MFNPRFMTAFLVVVLVASAPVWGQQTTTGLPFDPNADPAAQGTQTTTSTDTTGGAEVSSGLQLANQGYQMLAGRNFLQAKQLYEDAASADPRYQKMVQFVDNIIARAQDLQEEMWELEMKFNNPLQPEYTLEEISREDLNKMLEVQLKSQMAQGDLMGEFTLAELGLEDAKNADTLTLGEYLGWRRRKTINYRIYDQIMKKVYERQMRYARIEFLVQQRQERTQRREQLRQTRMEVTGGSFSVGGGGMGGLGGGYGLGGGMGGGMMGGGMMGGGFGGMGGGFGGGMMGGF